MRRPGFGAGFDGSALMELLTAQPRHLSVQTWGPKVLLPLRNYLLVLHRDRAGLFIGVWARDPDSAWLRAPTGLLLRPEPDRIIRLSEPGGVTDGP